MSREQSVTDIVAEAERAKLLAARASAREQELSTSEIVDGLRRLMDGKCWWLEQFSAPGPKRRPAHEIEARRRELAVLVQAHDRIIAQGRADARDPP